MHASGNVSPADSSGFERLPNRRLPNGRPGPRKVFELLGARQAALLHVSMALASETVALIEAVCMVAVFVYCSFRGRIQVEHASGFQILRGGCACLLAGGLCIEVSAL